MRVDQALMRVDMKGKSKLALILEWLFTAGADGRRVRGTCWWGW